MSLDQIDSEIQIARRATVFGQKRGGFTAMLCSVIDHVIQTMPKDAVTRLAFLVGVMLMAVHIFIA